MNATAQNVSGPAAAKAPEKYSMLEALRFTLDQAMAEDERVIVFGEDVADPEGGGVLGVTRGLSTKYGSLRCRSTPISEQAIIGAAIGAALGGYRPVAEIMLMNFTAVAMDMIVNHAAKLRFMSGGQTGVPITIRMLTGAGFGAGGQHCDYLEAWFAHTAGLKIVAPATPADAEGLMRSCIRDEDPCLFIENLQIYRTPGERLPAGEIVPLGKGRIARAGSDVTVIAHSRMVRESATAAEKLADQGISVELIDLRSISPWDRDLVLRSVAKTRAAVVVHEAVRNFGIGGEIASTIHEELFSQLRAPVRRVGAPFCPVPYSKPLETAFVPGPAAIEAAIRSVLN